MASSRKIIFVLIAISLGLIIAVFLGEITVRIISPQELSGTWRISCPIRGHLINKAGGSSRHQYKNIVLRYRFNSLHLRGPEIDENAKRVLFLGDSFTFGWLMEEENTFVHILGRYADKEFGKGVFQFLNGGAGGWGTANCVAFTEVYGEKIAPRVVVVFLSGDDIGRSVNSGLYSSLPENPLELKANIVPSSRMKKLMNSMPGYQFFLEHSHAFQLFRRYMINRSGAGMAELKKKPESNDNKQSVTDLPAKPDPEVLLGNALFLRLKKWCDGHNAKLLVMTTGFQQEEGFGTRADPTIRFMAQAEEFFASQAIPYNDLADDIRQAAGSDLSKFKIPGDAHPNEKGSALIAHSSRQWLMNQLKTE